MEIKDLKVGHEAYVNHWNCFYNYWAKKPLKMSHQKDL